MLEESWVAFWVTLVISPVCLLLLVIILTLHVRALWKDCSRTAKRIQHHHHQNSRKNNDNRNKVTAVRNISNSVSSINVQNRSRHNSHTMATDWQSWFRYLPVHSYLTKYGTVWVLFSFIIGCFLISCGRLNSAFRFKSGTARCQSAIYTLSVVWGCSKTCMYLVFVARLQTVFRDSSYRYSSKVILMFYISVLSVFIIATASLPWTMDGYLISIPRTLSGRRTSDDTKMLHICGLRMKMHGLLGFVGIITAFVIMFVIPIRKLAVAQEQNELPPNNEQLKLFILPIKYCLIGTVATVSTLISIVMSGLTGLIVVVMIDFVVNAVCLVLMTRFWDGLYWWLCSPILKCLAHDKVSILDDNLKDHLKSIIDKNVTL